MKYLQRPCKSLSDYPLQQGTTSHTDILLKQEENAPIHAGK